MEKISILTTPVEFDKSDYFSLLSLAVGNVIAVQNRMGELVIGDNGWNVDVRTGEITFGEKKFKCGILGTESNTSSTWLWGWAHTESGLPENAAAPSRRAKRNLGECAEFTTPKFLLDEIHTGHNLAITAVGAAEKNVAYYRCPYADGAVFVQIEGLPGEVFACLAPQELTRQYIQIIGSFYCDHRLLAAGILHQNGYVIHEETSGGYCLITGSNAQKKITFKLENAEGLFRTVDINMSDM